MLSDQQILYLSGAVIAFAVIAMVLVYVFGRVIFFRGWNGGFWDYFWDFLHRSPRPYPDIFRKTAETYLDRRNDFWSIFGQLYISIFLIATITVLLLTKTINADAGLPLLSAIVAFALARTSDKTRNTELPSERGEERPG